ncbi:Serine/threonine protein kinase [Microbispora rosea]|uniref:Serine/threonine protein kinase n=1 Tax=Microbispora rosea TaxID=58117 RepID=A0A1N6YWN7_9ACTN|nr:serine/threonine-protein kinase [Microbispora rosea]SIR18972.1 Serine/threonine protein kinase [Microbispora rosea]
MVAPLEPDDPRTLGGFRISGRLGEGGQGVVYLGHAPDGAPVAVKVLKTGLDPVVRARLTRELDVLRGVAPFCTARVITAMVDGREPYVVSEFVDGPSLQQRVTASGPLRGGELERLAVGTATALAAIHGAGIVHRDFKPGNVLLGPDGPRVVDFGIARHDESETMTAGPVGTPAYLAPEQIAGHPATPASDVFAWGATIVFAATGRAAFGAGNVAAVLHRIMTTFPDLTPVPPPLRAPVERCLAKDPSARPAARDLLLELVGTSTGPVRTGAAANGVSPGGPAQPYGPTSWPATSPPTGPAGEHGPAREHGPTGGRTAAGSGAAGSGAAGSGAAGSGAADTVPGGGRGGSRTRVLAGAGAAVAALGITAALLVPRLAAMSGGDPSPTPLASAPAQSTYTAGPTPTAAGTTGGADPATASAPAGIPQAFEGKWRGHIAPTAGLLTSEYDIEIELKAGKPSGRWKEPANSCDGTLRLTAASGPALRFRLEDVPQCVPGDVTLTLRGDALAYRHTDDLGLFAYEGTLTRDS